MNWRFLVFISGFLTIYGGLHLCIFRWLRPVLPAPGPLRLGLAAWFGLMILAPIIARVLEGAGWLTAAAVWDVVGFWWMGLVFIGFWLLGLCWLARLLLPMGPGAAARLVWLTLALTVALFAYGYHEAANPRLSFVRLPANLPPGVERIRLAQITDQHLGYTINSDRLANVCRMVAGQKPDLVISTGDLLENTLADPDHALTPLRGLNPPLGKWAVLGNHEYYMSLDVALDYHRRAGFQVLRDQTASVAGVLNLVGLDDRTISDVARELALLEGLPKGRPTIVLKHRPDVRPETEGRFDLMLSGHTHGGQMFPFGLVVRLVFPRLEGLHQLPGGGKLLISRGSGLWGPPLRIMAPPEVLIIDLVPAAGPPATSEK